MKRILTIITLLCISIYAFGQGTINVAGTVMDEKGIELVGVSITIKIKQIRERQVMRTGDSGLIISLSMRHSF